MYTIVNFKTKKQLKEALKANEEPLHVYQPGPFGPEAPKEGWVAVEGPHYPKAHTWYAQVRLEEGRIVEVK